MKWKHSDKDLPPSDTRLLFKDADNKSRSAWVSSGFYGCLIPVANIKATQGKKHKHILFHEDADCSDSRLLRFWWIPYPSHENI